MKYRQSALVQAAQGVIRPQDIINRATLVPSETYASKYALLISGGGDANSNWPSFWNDLKLVHSVLVQRYLYNPDNIIVIYADGIAPDSQLNVNYRANISNVRGAMNYLWNVMGPEDTLFFFATDHGTTYSGAQHGAEPSGESPVVDEGG